VFNGTLIEPAKEPETFMHPKPLRMYLNAGIRLFPMTQDGKPLCKWRTQEDRRQNGITTIEQLQQAWNKNIRRYGFLPADHELVVIDIDRKKGKDGLQTLKALCPDIYISVHTRTPSGGYHVYFKSKTQYISKDIYNGFEIISARHLCTAGGSISNTGKYKFYGNIANAIRLDTYPEITDLLTEAQNAPQPAQTHKTSQSTGKRHRTKPQGNKTAHRKRRPTLAELWQETEDQHLNAPGHRHIFRVVFAGKCKRLGYACDECLHYCLTHIATTDKDSGTLHRETTTDIRSMYK